MSAATGEKQWTSAGKTPQKFQFTPAPPKDWEAVILGANFEIAVANKPGAIPYIKGRLELLNSSETEGGKNKLLFPTFFLSLKPGKDGITSPDRASGVLGVARALGEQVDFPISERQDEDGQTIEMLDPRSVLQWFKDHTGMTIKLHSRVSPVKGADGKPTGEKRAEVDYYIEAEQGAF